MSAPESETLKTVVQPQISAATEQAEASEEQKHKGFDIWHFAGSPWGGVSQTPFAKQPEAQMLKAEKDVLEAEFQRERFSKILVVYQAVCLFSTFR